MRKVSEIFGTTWHLANKGRELYLSDGSLALPCHKKGHSLDSKTKAEVVEYYLSDDNSKEMAGMRDYVAMKKDDGTKVQIRKRLLCGTLNDLYCGFKAKQPSLDISYTSFMLLKPANCVFCTRPGAHAICVCTIHENVRLILEPIGDVSMQLSQFKSVHERIKFLISKTLCKPKGNEEDYDEACQLRNCQQCKKTDNNNKSQLIEYLEDSVDLHSTEEIHYKNWISSPCDFVTQTSEVGVYIYEVEAHLNNFIIHNFKVEHQRQYRHEQLQSLDSSTVLITVDFAETYQCIIQVPGRFIEGRFIEWTVDRMNA